MSRLFDLVFRMREDSGPRGKQLINRVLYEAIYSIPAVARSGFFNGGYRPLLPSQLQVAELAAAPHQAALYEFALRLHPGLERPAPGALLDIGCGLGGGLIYAAHAFPQARLTGIDQSRAAIRAARRRLRRLRPDAVLVSGGGDCLPFGDAGFDRVVSVGTLTYVGYEAFFAEAARVLAPGGVLSVTGGTTGPPLSWTRDRCNALAQAAGLEPLHFADLTAPCFAALQADADRNAEVIARLPGFLREYAREWAVLPGSRRFQSYLDGIKAEFGAVFAKPA